MKQMTQQQYESEIARRNIEWNKATAQERKVLLAKDALLQLKLSKLNVETGVWIRVNTTNQLELESSNDVRELSLKDNVSCNCCAVGGLMLSCTLYKDNVSLPKYNNYIYYVPKHHISTPSQASTSATNQLNQVFSEDELRMIEIYFELGTGVYKTTREANIGFKFHLPWIKKSPRERFVSIMRNIIRNNGDFIPSRKWSTKLTLQDTTQE